MIDIPIIIDLDKANLELSGMTPPERIQWAVREFGPKAVLLGSMQKTAAVLIHMFHELGLQNDVVFVDTGYHFKETLQIRDEYVARYGVNMVTVHPELSVGQQIEKYGQELYKFFDGQPVCCRERKELPFLKYIQQNKRKLVITGLMQTEGGRRGDTKPIRKDPRISGYAFAPIYDWDDEQVKTYLRENDIPVHPLHIQSYPSIGCEVCTTPVQPGEDARAGRWRHLREPGADGPVYCGINFSDGSGI